eukprot:GHVS01030782.1.p2 GENE.GHVS01030782.1~~GHVS01030782.1.p2  ORF type:complete len:181 (+),score=42.93 GHVS01030782.1:243-785(+)
MQFVCQSLKCLEFLRGRRGGGGGSSEDAEGYDPIGNMDFLQQEGEFASDDDSSGGAEWGGGKDIGTGGSRVINSSKGSSECVSPNTPKAAADRRKPAEEDKAQPFTDDRDLFNELGMEAQYKSPTLIHVSSKPRGASANSFPSVSHILAKAADDSVEGSGGLESWADVGVDFEEKAEGIK